MDSPKKSPAKSEIAQDRPRDSEGHFIPVEPTPTKKPKTPKSPIDQFFSQHTTYSKNQDDLINIHVGNPLRKITELLQEIKKQKAFAFTLKGSLGVMGVFLTLSVFGIFGGGQLLCDKGVQTHIGTLKVLNTFESNTTQIPILSEILNYVAPQAIHNRVILIAADGSTMNLPYTNKVNFQTYDAQKILVTGNYDACSRTIKIIDATSVERLM